MIARIIMKLFQNLFKDTKLNANEIAVCIDEDNNKFKQLDNYLSNIKIKKIASNTRVACSDTSTWVYKTLDEPYTNYDLILVRYASSTENSNEGNFTIHVVGASSLGDRLEHKADPNYWALIEVKLVNNNQVGLRTYQIKGWSASNMAIWDVYGIKF